MKLKRLEKEKHLLVCQPCFDAFRMILMQAGQRDEQVSLFILHQTYCAALYNNNIFIIQPTQTPSIIIFICISAYTIKHMT